MTRDERVKAARSFIGKTVEAEPLFTPHGVIQLRYAEWQAVAEMMESYRESVDAKRLMNSSDVSKKLAVFADGMAQGELSSSFAAVLREAAQTIELLKLQLLEAEVRIGAAFEQAVKGSGGCWPSWVLECQTALKVAAGLDATAMLRDALGWPPGATLHEMLNGVRRLRAASDKAKADSPQHGN